MSELTDLHERLQRALANLEGIRDGKHMHSTERRRINGKIEGVKLAISYLREDLRREESR